jgi:hypothetical protein
MLKVVKLAGLVAGLAVLAGISLAFLMPWMDSWGATAAEIQAAYPGDELLPAPAIFYNRAVTVRATPARIYPWILQLGAGRGGMYSYTWFETNVLQCELVNANRIHPEWQNLRVGDLVRMCPGNAGPPPYTVAVLKPDSAVVLGHLENGAWLDVWQFILIPQGGGTTRLILRSRDMKTGGIWDLIRPGEFIMSRGMLLGIKERAEATAWAARP